MQSQRLKRLTIVLPAVSVAMATVDAQGVPMVTTKYGKIRGFYIDLMAIFYRVPSAIPPVGNLTSVLVLSCVDLFVGRQCY